MSLIRRLARDWPLTVTALITATVFAHWVVAFRLHWPWILPDPVAVPESSALISIYLGMGAVAAIAAGFAGVIIVFGLTPTSQLFRTFRQRAGKRLVGNWLSVLSSAFTAAGLSIVASLLAATASPLYGGLLFEAGCLFLLHGGIRSLWILRLLLDVVNADDRNEQTRAATEDDGSLFD